MTSVRFDAQIRRGDFTVAASFDLEAGEVTALIGPNGAGKSSIVAGICGLEAVETGQIAIDGLTVDNPETGVFVESRDRRVGVVFQDHLLFPHLTTRDNVAFGLRSRGSAKSAARRRADELLESDGLAALANRLPGDLSGGQAQRVALLRALASEPDVLLLDEPFSALDVDARANVRSSFSERLRGFEGAVLLVTHDPTDVSMLADHMVVMEAGALVQQGSPHDVRRRPASAFAASFAGLNHLRAEVSAGSIRVQGTTESLHCSDVSVSGPALVTIAPSAIALYKDQPGGSPRNIWLTSIDSIEELGSVRRIMLGAPFELAADLTAGAVAAMDLNPGDPIWASVKATEIRVVGIASVP